MTARRVSRRKLPALRRPSPRTVLAIIFVIALVAFLVGVAQVWPPAAWILGGLLGMAFALAGLANLRTNR